MRYVVELNLLVRIGTDEQEQRKKLYHQKQDQEMMLNYKPQ